MIFDKLTICLFFTILLLSCDTINETQREEEYEQREEAFIEGIENYDVLDLREKANDDFAKWLFEDTCTFYYNFPNATDSTEIVNIAESDDGNVRIYSWDTQLGGTMVCWDNVIQFRSNGKLESYDGSIWSVDESQEKNEIDFGCWTKAIYTFKRNDGQTIYITESYFRESSSFGYSTLDAFCISNGKLQTIENAFVIPDESSHIGKEYSIPSWYFLTDGKGWDWIYSLDRNTQTFYVPVVDDLELLDQYDLYKFNGTKFVYIGREGGYWLHPSIRKFERLEKLDQVGKFLIRIDRISTGNFRYSSWSGTEDMTKKPDIIIENGKYDKEKNEYSFINGKYTYYINIKEEGTELVVMHKNEVILTAE
jgi:hypothetical protein